MLISMHEIPEGHVYSPSREDDLVVWKQAWVFGVNEAGLFVSKPVIVELLIPQYAGIVFTPTKCRASDAKVVGFYSKNRESLSIPRARSYFMPGFAYVLHDVIYVENFNCDPRVICGSGIHFFRTFEEAAEYMWP